jgi:zinc-dependent metalloproteinase lipoprotein
MKKKLLLLGTGICLLLCTQLNAQRDPDTGDFYGTCGTLAPTDASEQAFQKQIAAYKLEKAKGRVASYEIPVIVHILYKQGLAVGSAANIAAAQVKAQLDALNDCMAGKAPGNSKLPTPFANVDANDIPIRFCLAVKGPDGKTLAEPGIDRINFTAKGWTDPATASDPQTLFDKTVKPASIWDPKQYFNIWVGDFFDPAKGGLLGYATFPLGTGLSGLTSNLETASTSGVVMATRVFGCKAKYANGYYASESYIYGITTAHEVGHYLGLRHIGGDSPCSTDYCNDTPAQKGGYQSGPNGQNWGCPSYPFQANACGSGTSPNGEMFQNFMDYTTDACRSLFTQDQADRMMTAMQNGTYRKAFGTHGLCSSGAVPTASFNADKTSICAGSSVAFSDKSANAPTAWKWTFTGGTPATSTQQNPTVTYSTAGTYDVKLVVSNAQGKDSSTQVKYITVNSAAAAPTVTSDKRCGPGVVNLSASGSSTLEWYDAATGGNKVNTGTTYAPNVSTTTTYYVVNPATPCPSQRVPVTATINPIPAKPTITIASNGVDLTASSGTSYQWFLNGNKISGATAQTYTVKEKGNYTVMITDANGCSAVSDPTVITGISALENQAFFEVFPNPSNGSFTFNLNVIEKGDYQIQVKNMLGQQLYSESLNNFKGTYNKQFDLSVYGKGVYVLTLMNASGQQIKKIIVE